MLLDPVSTTSSTTGSSGSISKDQVGIGTENPHASAVLELKSDNQGLLLPRVNPADIDNTAEGLFIYNSVEHCVSLHNNTGWNCLSLVSKTSSITRSSGSTSKGKIGIGTENPHASAVLELKSDNKGLLLPRVNPADVDNPAEGLLIYNSVEHRVSVYKNTKWHNISLLVSIPDPIFRAYLKQTIPNAFPNGGDKMDANSGELKNLTEINVREKNISSLQGIRYFTGLKKLNCSKNQITALDVKKNTALTHLSCDNNQLTSLDVSKSTALTYLSCHHNKLMSLDLSQNCNLTQSCGCVYYDSNVWVTWHSNP